MSVAEHLIRRLMYGEWRVRLQSDNQMLYDERGRALHARIHGHSIKLESVLALFCWTFECK
jgi:hypothetical protein